MSFLKPDPPSPPNPIDTARAATGTNVGTAVANANLQNINQITPGGSLNYSTTGNYTWTDPTTGQSYNIPTFTATQSLTPSGQATFDQQQAAQLQMAQIANQQTGRVGSILGTPFDPNFNAQQYLQNNPDVLAAARASGTNQIPYAAMHYQLYGQGEGRSGGSPQAGTASGIAGVAPAARSYSTGGPIQTSLGPQGAITNTYGPADNFSADRQRVEESLMARMNPQLQIEQQRVQQQLADQGIRYGSQAYSDAMRNYSQQADDTRWGAIQNAGQEQQRMVQEAAQLAAFQNAAQQQGYEQNLGTGQFYNAAQGQQYQQNAALAAFGNAGMAQQLQQQQAVFNASQAARNQYMQEQYAQRNQPLNEISSLLSGSQVQQPNFINTPGAQIPTTDIAGLVNQNFQQQLGIYQQQSQNANSTIGGILGLGAGALKGGYISDRREKENISRMGTTFAATDDNERKELPIYAYSYKKDPASITHIGPMAQDVEKITPEAVDEHEGVKYIKPRQVIGSILRAS